MTMHDKFTTVLLLAITNTFESRTALYSLEKDFKDEKVDEELRKSMLLAEQLEKQLQRTYWALKGETI